ncbi:MAG: hypothetical protein AAFP19_10370 [Bacteroidota bacterium]
MHTDIKYWGILGLIVLVSACSVSKYEFKGKDFGTYFSHPKDLDNSFLSKFNEGIYLFEMCNDTKIVGIDEVNWLNYCDSVPRDENGRKEISQYAYFAFVDGCRVIYYTNYADDGFEISLDATFEEEDTTTYSDYYYLEYEIDFLRNNYRYSLRGYYYTELRLRADNQQDTLVRMKLEKSFPKSKLFSRNKKNPLIEFTFLYDEGQLILEEIRTKPISKTARSSQNIYHPGKILSVKPIYRHLDFTVRFRIDTRTDKKEPRQQNFFDKVLYQKDSIGDKTMIIYYDKEREVFRESTDKLRSW